MDETTIGIIVGVGLLSLGSWLRIRGQRRRRERLGVPPSPPPGE